VAKERNFHSSVVVKERISFKRCGEGTNLRRSSVPQNKQFDALEFVGQKLGNIALWVGGNLAS
jgi:hypothetical protein